MTPIIEPITNKEQIEYFGMDSDVLKRIIVNVKLQNSVISHDLKQDELLSKIEKEWNQQQTPLDICLATKNINFEDDNFEAILYDEKPEITVAVLHDSLMMKLFPPKGTMIENSLLKLPVFEIEYIVENINNRTDDYNVIQSIISAKNMFDGEFLFELLNKAVRSQRNKIEKQFNEISISEAMELIERENNSVNNILANSKAYSLIRNKIQMNQYENAKIINFSPVGRMNKNRVYFMGDPQELGRIVKTKCKINIETLDNQYYNISCLMRMGAVILNRNIISVIEH